MEIIFASKFEPVYGRPLKKTEADNFCVTVSIRPPKKKNRSVVRQNICREFTV
jgi:hypothetical protein